MGGDEGEEDAGNYDYFAEIRQVFYFGAGLAISEIKNSSFRDIYRWYLGKQLKDWDLFSHLEAFLAGRIPLTAESLSPASLNPYRNKIKSQPTDEEVAAGFDAMDKAFAFAYGKK